MMLSDMGANLIRVVRKGDQGLVDQKFEVLHRGRPSVAIDLTKPEGVAAVLKLVEQADALQEGFRPGVMERLGLGPGVCLKRNPRLVYARMTGWGQEGPLSHAAGHDLNYIALSGALHAMGKKGEKPPVPLNLVGDFGGGGMLQAFGMVCALLEAQRSGQGQVVDTAMVDGAATLMAIFYGLYSAGVWWDRGTNLLDSGAHFYDTYETADGKYVSVGSIEPKFYAELIKLAGIEDPEFQNQMDVTKWPELKEKITQVFKSKTRPEWCELMEGTDVCFAPVLSFDEAINHPHNVARNTFVEVAGVIQPGPAPRFSRTKCEIRFAPPDLGADTETGLADWGFDAGEIQALKDAGAI
jgi:alpha-methylacyl-CoA racemase